MLKKKRQINGVFHLMCLEIFEFLLHVNAVTECFCATLSPTTSSQLNTEKTKGAFCVSLWGSSEASVVISRQVDHATASTETFKKKKKGKQRVWAERQVQTKLLNIYRFNSQSSWTQLSCQHCLAEDYLTNQPILWRNLLGFGRSVCKRLKIWEKILLISPWDLKMFKSLFFLRYPLALYTVYRKPEKSTLCQYAVK